MSIIDGIKFDEFVKIALDKFLKDFESQEILLNHQIKPH